tara:strand:- start:45 stop:419 length:375 start_codon:yes stop_codon:yes gene_type:complete
MSNNTQSNYLKLSLELREWTSKKTGTTGENYTFNNSSDSYIDVFGMKGKLSYTKAGEEFKATQANDSCFIWLNDMDDDSYEAFVEEYGETIYIHKDSKALITQQQYDELDIGATEQASSQPSAF